MRNKKRQHGRIIYGKAGVWKDAKALILRWHPICIRIDTPGNHYHNWVFTTDYDTLNKLFYI